MDVRIRLLEVETGRNGAMPNRKRNLNKSGYSGGCFKMTDVGFYGPDDQRISLAAVDP
jgi:hypothetical protein